MAKHEYQIEMNWTGNQGKGTADARSYERSYTLSAEGKPDLSGSSDPNYLGDASKWNPEELLLGALSACHMLFYLHLCATKKIIVQDYKDAISGELDFDASGIGKFSKAILRPKITLADLDQIETAKALHADAHKRCFISNSVNFPTEIEPEFVQE